MLEYFGKAGMMKALVAPEARYMCVVFQSPGYLEVLELLELLEALTSGSLESPVDPELEAVLELRVRQGLVEVRCSSSEPLHDVEADPCSLPLGHEEEPLDQDRLTLGLMQANGNLDPNWLWRTVAQADSAFGRSHRCSQVLFSLPYCLRLQMSEDDEYLPREQEGTHSSSL